LAVPHLQAIVKALRLRGMRFLHRSPGIGPFFHGPRALRGSHDFALPREGRDRYFCLRLFGESRVFCIRDLPGGKPLRHRIIHSFTSTRLHSGPFCLEGLCFLPPNLDSFQISESGLSRSSLVENTESAHAKFIPRFWIRRNENTLHLLRGRANVLLRFSVVFSFFAKLN